MFKKLYLLILLSLTTTILTSTKIEARIKVDAKNNWEIVYNDFDPKTHYVATAYYTDSLNETGWDKLSISTNPIFRDEIQAEGAGRLEGELTKERIYYHYLNAKDSIIINEKMAQFLDDQEAFVYDSVEKGDGYMDPMLYNAYLIKIQYNALMEQYNISADEDKKLKKINFHLMNYYPELFDLENKYRSEEEGEIDYTELDNKELFKLFLERTHCSALFKIKDDLSDIYFGHNTWNSYYFTIRIIKEYNLNYNNKWVRSKNIIFTSYPATMSSIDDFYLTSNGLIAIETTNGFYNDTLYSKILPNSIFTSERAMISNRISNSSKEWVENYAKYNSGTYNNQYMILDKNKVNLVNKSIEQDAFYVVETLPGLVKINNITDILKFGYWSSYNIPYDKEIYNISGLGEVIEKKLEAVYYLSYDINARAKIFRRDHNTSENLEGFKKLMRLNKYLSDPYSEKNPSYTISSRSDLNGDCGGAYDCKVGVLSELIEGKIKFHLISGPTFGDDNIKPFSWETAPANCRNHNRYLLPETFDFDWIEYEPDFPF